MTIYGITSFKIQLKLLQITFRAYLQEYQASQNTLLTSSTHALLLSLKTGSVLTASGLSLSS
ncbi:hypothetical protein HanRHA438_Chr04g0176061 [Helianthus annuus]|nr:hypothetical protein HanIR_Chr04g0179461 [Helianthus annuus]KAJ0926850.1 hypothetical protein HanRHA438_Chr04g0176061 [Helianthus annuus]